LKGGVMSAGAAAICRKGPDRRICVKVDVSSLLPMD
jgi:hypothetical protein